MFEDIVGQNKDYDEKILVSKSEYKALKDNVNTKQKLIDTMITELVAHRLKIRELESILDSISIDGIN